MSQSEIWFWRGMVTSAVLLWMLKGCLRLAEVLR